MTLQAVDDSYTPEPHSIVVEQGLLGAIMASNEALQKLPYLTAEHFYDPLHRRIFETIRNMVEGGQQAVPATLKPHLEVDGGMQTVGGPVYLSKLVKVAVAPFLVEEWARTVFDLAKRREASRLLLGGDDRLLNKAEPLPDILAGIQAELAILADDDIGGAELKPVQAASDAALAFVEDAFNSPGTLRGATTGIPELDALIGGLQPGHNLILGGRTSMGKSTVAGIIAKGAAQAGHGVGIFTPEMPSEEYMTRLQTCVAYRQSAPVHYVNALRGNITREDFQRLYEAHSEILEWPLFIDDTPGLTVEAIAAESKRLKRRLEREGKSLSLVVVDHIGKLRYEGPHKMKVHQIEHIVASLKDLAKALDIAVISVCQLNRSVDSRDNKRPMMSDLRDSGAIEQEADEVIFCYRAEYYLERENDDFDNTKKGNIAKHENQMSLNASRNKLELIVAKQRMGPTDTLTLKMDIKAGAIMGQEQEGFEL